MVVFTDGTWTDGEERTYLMWDYIEVPGRYLTLRIEEGENNLLETKLFDVNVSRTICMILTALTLTNKLTLS